MLTLGILPGGGARKLQEADVPQLASGVAENPRLLCTSEAQEAESGATLGLYSPPASCRRCASGPPRRSRAHGRPLLHAPEPGGQVWARPMGPPAPRRAAPGRLKARCRRTPSAALRPGAREQADSTAPAPRLPAPGPWSQDCRSRARPCLALLLLPPKRKKQEKAERDDKTFGGGPLAVSGGRARPGERARRAVEAASPPAWGRRGKGRIWGK